MLSPEEIEQQTFPVARRGYDQAEVDAFLRQLAGDLRLYVDETRAASDEAAARAAAAEAAAKEAAEASVAAPAPPIPEQAAELLAAAEREAARIRNEAAAELAMVQRARSESDDHTVRNRESLQRLLDAGVQARAQADAEASELLAVAEREAGTISDAL
ncbi:MAG TPA: DivIVA domain-containing protein, partial [Acidimicrobiales bacterium]